DENTFIGAQKKTEPDNPVLAWIADFIGLKEEVRRKRLEAGFNPDTLEPLQGPNHIAYGPPTADGSVAGNTSIVGDITLHINGMRPDDARRVAGDMEKALG